MPALPETSLNTERSRDVEGELVGNGMRSEQSVPPPPAFPTKNQTHQGVTQQTSSLFQFY